MTAAEFQAQHTAPKRHKFGAQRTEAFGMTFDSKKEAKRYGELRALQIAGVISDLTCQVHMPLYGQNGMLRTDHGRQIKYVADFVYREDGVEVIEDTKGVRTPEYRLKKAILKSMGKEIRET